VVAAHTVKQKTHENRVTDRLPAGLSRSTGGAASRRQQPAIRPTEVLAGRGTLWLDEPMALPDELLLRCLPATPWPHDDDDRLRLRAHLRRHAPAPTVIGWQLGELSDTELLARAGQARQLGRVVAAVLPADALNTEVMERLDAGVPLLVALTPPKHHALAAWRSALATIAACRSATLRFAPCGAPPCHLGTSRLDLRLRLQPPERAAALAPACGGCAQREGCAGPGTRGAIDAEVTPLPTPVSNQFDVVQQDVIPWPADATGETPCPVAAGLVGAGESRDTVLIAVEEGLRRCRVDADSWAREELVRALDRHGQLYLDASEKARLDDFAADLRALQRVHAPHDVAGGHCPGLWRVADQQPFAAEEAELRSEISQLHGTIVDVGAGPIRYTGALAAAISAGTVRYLAVEPDAVALATSATALPGGHFVRGVAESLPVADGVADAVMLLRSYNHLRDLARSFHEAARVLRPGGTLLVVDNVTFGLARSAAQLARARAVPAAATPFEHFRDHNADEAAAALAVADAFEIERSLPVGPGRSNQWLVRARRLAEAT